MKRCEEPGTVVHIHLVAISLCMGVLYYGVWRMRGELVGWTYCKGGSGGERFWMPSLCLLVLARGWFMRLVLNQEFLLI